MADRGGVVFNAVDTLLDTCPSLKQTAVAIRFKEDVKHDLSWTPLNGFASVIPRSLWAEKPYPIGILVRQHYSGDRIAGMPLGLTGELWFVGEHFAVVFGGLFFGLILSLVNRSFRLLHYEGLVRVIYPLFIYTCVFRVYRNGIEPVIVDVIAYLFSGVIVLCALFTSFLFFSKRGMPVARH